MKADFFKRLAGQTDELRAQGLYKSEAVLNTPQQAVIELTDGSRLINLCANNYLGLANHPAVREAAKAAIDLHGYGMASVRFICGTHAVHRRLEETLSDFLRMDDAILYSSCFDANGGLFETLLDEQDAIISDALNHASIIDGVRLCKAQRLRYANGDMNELEARLKEASNARVRLIATDGVFSMDGVIAPLKAICDLADRYDALVMVDDSHAVGFLGAHGRGTHELLNVMDRIDILTGTLGKALGGASGGYTAGRKEIIAWLRQRSRPYLFSNSIPPAIAAASLKALEILHPASLPLRERVGERGSSSPRATSSSPPSPQPSATAPCVALPPASLQSSPIEGEGTALREKLWSNAAHFRHAMSKAGFTLAGAGHPIIPVMLGDAKLASEFAQRLRAHGVLAVGFSYPVVPLGKARIRTQLSAAHTPEHLQTAVTAFTAVGRELGVIK